MVLLWVNCSKYTLHDLRYLGVVSDWFGIDGFLFLWKWLVVLGNWIWCVSYHLWNDDVYQVRKENKVKGFDRLNKAFDSRVRLGVMSILVVNEWVPYKDLKEQLELTDGNLASHISALEKLKYVEVKKQFVGKRPLTTYRITKKGREAFSDHIQALEDLLKG